MFWKKQKNLKKKKRPIVHLDKSTFVYYILRTHGYSRTGNTDIAFVIRIS